MEKKTKKQSDDEKQFEMQNLPFEGINIESLIREIRGQKVMLDFDLAMLYGEKTKRLNEQVKRNINRFPDDFMFQLSKKEWNQLWPQIIEPKTPIDEAVTLLRSQIATAKDISKMRNYPYAFTRNGIAMLSSVLRSETAVEVNKRIMRAFTAMSDMMKNDTLIMQRILNIEQHQTETDKKVNQILITIEEQTPKQLPEQLFNTGCIWDAWTYVSDLIRSAKQRIELIDNYVDDRVLSLIDKRTDTVEATIHTRYDEPFLTDLKKHNEQYREIKFVQLPHRNHDRFLIIDDTAYSLGASVKDMGVGMCAVIKLHTPPEIILGMLK